MFSLYFIVHSLDIEGNKMVRNSSSCQQPSQILIAKCKNWINFDLVSNVKRIFKNVAFSAYKYELISDLSAAWLPVLDFNSFLSKIDVCDNGN